jgi:hypothetical protein
VVEAIQKQAAELIHISGTDFYYEGLAELAERLSDIAPGKESKKVYFGNSGTEAVEAAIKLARYHTRRDKIIAFHGCFHGRTMGALSLTASKSVQRKGFGALLAGVFHIPYPNSYRCPYGNPSPCTCVESAEYLEREIFKRMIDPSEVAAVFIEPIQGEGGYLPASKEFLLVLQPSRVERIFAGVATDLPQARNLAGVRRSAERHGTHGQVVGVRARRNRAGHFVRGQGYRFGYAAFRDHCAGELDGLETGGACVHVWRKPGEHCGGAGDDGFAGDAIH